VFVLSSIKMEVGSDHDSKGPKGLAGSRGDKHLSVCKLQKKFIKLILAQSEFVIASLFHLGLFKPTLTSLHSIFLAYPESV